MPSSEAVSEGGVIPFLYNAQKPTNQKTHPAVDNCTVKKSVLDNIILQ